MEKSGGAVNLVQPRSGGSPELPRLRRLSSEVLFSTGLRRWLENCRRYAALRGSAAHSFFAHQLIDRLRQGIEAGFGRMDAIAQRHMQGVIGIDPMTTNRLQCLAERPDFCRAVVDR